MNLFERYQKRIRAYIRPPAPQYADKFTDERVAKLMSTRDSSELIKELMGLYDQLEDDKVIAAGEVRQAFLLALRNSRATQVAENLVQFLTQHVQPEDYAEIKWETPEQVVTFCEVLYSSRFEGEDVANRAGKHVRYLLRTALQHFEAQEEPEKMFQLLRIAPLPPLEDDAEFMRLRSRAYLYEMRRVKRVRRILYGYLLVQVVLVIAIFPFLFIQSENCNIQETVEETANVEMTEDICRKNIHYPDALYWAVITASSIGYGDLTPLTSVGKVMAAMLGTMGVITVGMIAGLVLNWIRPRQFD